MNTNEPTWQYQTNQTCSLESLVATLESQIQSAIQRDRLGRTDLEYFYQKGDVFDDSFPKSCESCGLEFKSREDYLRNTSKPRKIKPNTEYFTDKLQVMECRDCNCGHSLIMVAECRRDATYFGIECRAYFNLCIEKLVQDSGFSHKDAEDLARVIFRSVLSEAKQGV